jgi:hypothetical protein
VPDLNTNNSNANNTNNSSSNRKQATKRRGSLGGLKDLNNRIDHRLNNNQPGGMYHERLVLKEQNQIYDIILLKLER